ncbi:MAG TPA: Rieske (2Fe-2S) protein, partial [Terrimesophilobacter sp.]|nr:Rieske (2Fe-2S) protein [Terrimesophilobacter sp.]
MESRSPTRRAVLIAGMGAGTALLAACGSPDTGSAGSTPGTPPLPAGTVVHTLANIPVGGTAAAEVDGHAILLSQPTKGRVAAFSAICPHQGCRVAAQGADFECPCHGSRFDGRTGAVLTGPSP